MAHTSGHYKKDPIHPEKATHQDEENYGLYSSPRDDYNGIPLSYIFKAALTTTMVMLAVAALVWRYYTPAPLAL